MSNPTITPTLVSPFLSGLDVPIDGGNASDNALRYLTLAELRVHSQYLYAIARGYTAVDPPEIIRADNLIEPTFVRNA